MLGIIRVGVDVDHHQYEDPQALEHVGSTALAAAIPQSHASDATIRVPAYVWNKRATNTCRFIPSSMDSVHGDQAW